MSRKRTSKKSKTNKKNFSEKLRKAKIKLLVGCLMFIGFYGFHIYRHPPLLFYPVSEVFNKSVEETWSSYHEIFDEYASRQLSPEFLAALAQTESMGNPLALTYWTASINKNPLRWYRPASTATGLLQVTKGTWKQMKNYCLKDRGQLGYASKGHCSPGALRFRTSASDSIELVSAWFHRHLKGKKMNGSKKRAYLSTLHLCGLGKARALRKNGFNLKVMGKCGSHRLATYVRKVEKLYLQVKGFKDQKSGRYMAKR